MVLTVMPSIMRTLYIDVRDINQAGWIITGYLLGYTVAMPVFGRLADVWGRRPMCVVALLLFMIGSIFCVFLNSLHLIVAARVVQAAGGGALVPIAMAASADMFPTQRRALILGIIGGAAEAGGVLGPIYGAALSAVWTWRLIFLINVPLCLILIAVAWRLLRPGLPHFTDAGASEEESTGAAKKGRHWWERSRVDYIGAALLALALAGITIGLGTGTQTVNSSTTSATPVRWPWLAASVVAFVFFLLVERRHNKPVVRLDFFKRPAFAAANFANLLVGAALIIGMVEVPLYAYTLFGMTEIQAGLLLIRFTIMIPVGAIIGGWVADWIGYRVTAVLGFLIAAGGYLLVSHWPIDPSGGLMTRDLLISGLGFGLVIGPISASVVSASGPRWMASGSALVTVSRMVGMVIGLSALSSWGVRRYNALTAHLYVPIVRPSGLSDAQWQAMQNQSEAALRGALHTVFSDFFTIAAIVIAVAVIPALFFYRSKMRETGRLPFMPH